MAVKVVDDGLVIGRDIEEIGRDDGRRFFDKGEVFHVHLDLPRKAVEKRLGLASEKPLNVVLRDGYLEEAGYRDEKEENGEKEEGEKDFPIAHRTGRGGDSSRGEPHKGEPGKVRAGMKEERWGEAHSGADRRVFCSPGPGTC